jgi:enoyl-CoA hydratase/carnithine racemase
MRLFVTTAYETILYDTDYVARVATLTLNRPESRLGNPIGKAQVGDRAPRVENPRIR